MTMYSGYNIIGGQQQCKNSPNNLLVLTSDGCYTETSTACIIILAHPNHIIHPYGVSVKYCGICNLWANMTS